MPGGQGHGAAVDAEQGLVAAEQLEAVAVEAVGGRSRRARFRGAGLRRRDGEDWPAAASCSRSTRRCAWAAATVASTSDNVCGATADSVPVMSTTPSRAPESGSWNGTAVQLHGCTERL